MERSRYHKRMIHKGLFFIFKEVAVKYKELHSAKPPQISQRQATQTVLYSSKRKNPTRKKKKRARSSAIKKSHNTNTKFNYGEVTITSEDYKIFLSKITISKIIRHIGQHPIKAESQENEREREGEREREREGESVRRREREKTNKESGT